MMTEERYKEVLHMSFESIESMTSQQLDDFIAEVAAASGEFSAADFLLQNHLKHVTSWWYKRNRP